MMASVHSAENERVELWLVEDTDSVDPGKHHRSVHSYGYIGRHGSFESKEMVPKCKRHRRCVYHGGKQSEMSG